MITLVDRLVEPEIAIDDDAETSSFRALTRMTGTHCQEAA